MPYAEHRPKSLVVIRVQIRAQVFDSLCPQVIQNMCDIHEIDLELNCAHGNAQGRVFPHMRNRPVWTIDLAFPCALTESKSSERMDSHGVLYFGPC